MRVIQEKSVMDAKQTKKKRSKMVIIDKGLETVINQLYTSQNKQWKKYSTTAVQYLSSE